MIIVNVVLLMDMTFARVVEAVEIMEELEYTTLEHADIFGKTWYYVCCMDLILVTGTIVIFSLRYLNYTK